MSHSLAEADVHAVIVRTADRFLVANTGELRIARHWLHKSIQGGCAANTTHGYALIDVDGLVFVQAQNMCVLHFEGGVLFERPTVTDVKLLCYRVAIVRVHQAANATRSEGRGGRRNRWKRTDAVLPLTKGKACTRNRVARAR